MSQKSRKPKLKDRSASEDSLLCAAEEAFSRHGFDGTTTREIAKKAGINQALIARYFDSKYGLLLAVIKRKMEAFRAVSLPDLKPSLTEECASYAADRFHQITKNVDFVRIVFGQVLTNDNFLKRFREVMPIEAENPQFEERLQNLIKQHKVSSECEPKELLDIIERLVMNAILFDLIMLKKSKEKALLRMLKAVKAYASYFER